MSEPSISLLSEETKKQDGVVTGEVTNLADPLMQGRVQVRIPSIDCFDLSHWCRVAVPMAGPGHGSYFIPSVGDQVLVAFEHGDLCSPCIIGSLYNARSFPPLPTPIPQIRAERTMAGNQVVFTEMPPTVTIQTGWTPPEFMPALPSPAGPHQTIALNPEGVQVIATTITQTAGGAITTNTTGAITQTAGGAMELQAVGKVGMNAGGAMSLAAGAAFTIQGGAINVSAGGAIAINATGAITLTAGSSSIVLSPDGVKIVAPTVAIVGICTVNGLKPVLA